MSRFHLYRHYDANGDLLYVGQSNSCFERFREHRVESKWTPLSATMRIEYFDSREEVSAAERRAIVLEKPRFNVREVPRQPPPECRLSLDMSKQFANALDEWRRQQPDIPGRAEAIRRLTALALEADKKGRRGK